MRELTARRGERDELDRLIGAVARARAGRGLMNSRVPISGFESPSRASRAIIFIVVAQKLVPDLEGARKRINEHALKLEDARAYAAYGQNSYVGKDPRDPPGATRAHPRRPHPTVGRRLRT